VKSTFVLIIDGGNAWPPPNVTEPVTFMVALAWRGLLMVNPLKRRSFSPVVRVPVAVSVHSNGKRFQAQTEAVTFTAERHLLAQMSQTARHRLGSTAVHPLPGSVYCQPIQPNVSVSQLRVLFRLTGTRGAKQSSHVTDLMYCSAVGLRANWRLAVPWPESCGSHRA
jgi:hypothetical protein